MTVRLEVMGDDGEWHELPGIGSVHFDQEQPDVDLRDEAYRRHDAFDAMVCGIPGVADVGEFFTVAAHADRLRAACALAEAAMREAARRLRVIDQDGKPVRPAWQSPYGPRPRRR